MSGWVDAAVEEYARREAERHRAHGCPPDATRCVLTSAELPDDRPALEAMRDELVHTCSGPVAPDENPIVITKADLLCQACWNDVPDPRTKPVSEPIRSSAPVRQPAGADPGRLITIYYGGLRVPVPNVALSDEQVYSVLDALDAAGLLLTVRQPAGADADIMARWRSSAAATCVSAGLRDVDVTAEQVCTLLDLMDRAGLLLTERRRQEIFAEYPCPSECAIARDLLGMDCAALREDRSDG